MKKSLKTAAFIISLFSVLIITSSCGGSGETSPEPFSETSVITGITETTSITVTTAATTTTETTTQSVKTTKPTTSATADPVSQLIGKWKSSDGSGITILEFTQNRVTTKTYDENNELIEEYWELFIIEDNNIITTNKDGNVNTENFEIKGNKLIISGDGFKQEFNKFE